MQKSSPSHRRGPYARINWDKAKILFQQPLPEQREGKKSIPVKDILSILAAVGAVGALFVFPGAAPAFGSLVLGRRNYSRWQTRQVVNRLTKQKYAKAEYLDDGRVKVTITRTGLVKALTYELAKMQLKKPDRWDRKWRAVIFDIPEKYKRIRDIFRMRLRQLSLYQLQESVYVAPYPCFEEIEFLRELYGVAFTVRYLLVEKIEDSDFLKAHFHLK